MKATELLQKYAGEGEQCVAPQNDYLQYEGRIDFSKESGPLLVYPASSIRVRFRGSFLDALVTNYHAYWENYMGVLVDGREHCVKLNAEGITRIPLFREEPYASDGEQVHEVLFFKRQDACHIVQFHGFFADRDVRLLSVPSYSPRRMEVYGDSVSAGEVSEAVDYCGQPDPAHQGEYSNSYHSYAWIAARELDARLHNISQGGIALMDGTGYFMEPEQLGMETVFDKILYQPQILRDSPRPLGAGGTREPVTWDFARYEPQVVLVAVGQNDAYPVDFCAEDIWGEQASRWRSRYAAFLNRLRGIYPGAHIICMTTILHHHENWDRSIDDVCAGMGDSRIYHFTFRENGRGTKGHIRRPEAEKMAAELVSYIRGMGENIWRDMARLEHVFARAERGERLTVGFIGGSITQGSLASEPELCYASLVHHWWCQKFPDAEITKVNAGIGGTSSHFGTARADEHLLNASPDVVFVEFSVNDEPNSHFQECYEGLVRRILCSGSKPALIVLYNCYYTDGHSARAVHEAVARHYALPEVRMGEAVYSRMVSGEYSMSDLTPDGLHPNDRGHAMLADEVVRFLEDAYRCFSERKLFSGGRSTSVNLPSPLTANRYERAHRLQNTELSPVRCHGFTADNTEADGIRDLFRNGWSADACGSEICFEITSSCLAIQYRRTIQKPAPKAAVIMDGDEEHPVFLDGNFDEDWGDCLALEVLCEQKEKKKHSVTVRIVEAEGVRTPFYLVSFLV